MYLDIGGDVILHWEEVIVIMDFKPWHHSPYNQSLLQAVTQKAEIKDLAFGQPKSYVITKGDIYISPISVTTLKKRITFT